MIKLRKQRLSLPRIAARGRLGEAALPDAHPLRQVGFPETAAKRNCFNVDLMNPAAVRYRGLKGASSICISGRGETWASSVAAQLIRGKAEHEHKPSSGRSNDLIKNDFEIPERQAAVVGRGRFGFGPHHRR